MRSCRVYFRDRQGVEHGVYVNAENRYHAFGLAMHELRRCSWSNPDYSGVERLSIQVVDSRDAPVGRRIMLTRDEFEKWLGPPNPLSSDKLRTYLQMLLGRIPPDREFKNGFKH